MIPFDSLFDTYGHHNRYEFCVTLCGCIFAAWLIPSVSVNFVAAPLDHWCDLTDFATSDRNLTFDDLKRLLIPNDGQSFSKCYMYNVSDDDPMLAASGIRNFTDRSLIPCRYWSYDTSTFKSSIVSKYDLVCDREWLTALSSSLFMLGIAFGAITAGFVSDRIGRLRTFTLYLILLSSAGMTSCFAPNYITFAVCRMLIGIGNTGTWISINVLMMEEVGPKWRPVVGVVFQMSYTVGYLIMVLVAYLIRDNTYFQLALALPTLTYFSFYFICVESPRWLLVQGKYTEALKSLKKLFGANNRELLNKMNLSDITTITEKNSQGRWSLLFRYPKVYLKIMILHYQWFSVSLVYYALSLNSASIPGNLFVVTFLLGLVEIPANLICIVLCRWQPTGRKRTATGALLLAGLLSILCVPLLITGYLSAVTVLSMCGKFCVSMAWSALYVLSFELYPTEVRNAAIGSSAFCSYASGALGSFVGGPLYKIWAPLPYIIYGFLGVTAGLMGYFLPETLAKQLCETVVEAVKYGLVHQDSIVVELETKAEVDNGLQIGRDEMFQNESNVPDVKLLNSGDQDCML